MRNLWGAGISRKNLYETARSCFPDSDVAKIDSGKHPQWTWYENRFGKLATWRANWAAMGDRAYNRPNFLGVLGELEGLEIDRPEGDNEVKNCVCRRLSYTSGTLTTYS